MLPLLLIIFIVVPIAELAVIIQVGQEIGVWLDDRDPDRRLDPRRDAACARRDGSRGGASTRRCRPGASPTREVLDGVLVIFGGAFLLTPGFITDIFGIALPDPADARDRAAAAGAARRGADDRGARRDPGAGPSPGAMPARATSTAPRSTSSTEHLPRSTP